MLLFPGRHAVPPRNTARWKCGRSGSCDRRAGVTARPPLGPTVPLSAARYADRLVPDDRGKAMATTSGFAGFRPAAFAFFDEPRDNNDPAWFRPRKAIYEAEIL